MIIWILALLLVLGTVALGYTMGAVRVGISTLGLLIGAWICVPVAPILHPVFNKIGLGTKIHAFYIAPLIILMLVLVVFKVIASTVHQKVDAYYKYKTADFVQTLWLRTNERFGAALGLINATVYLFIISTVIYVMAYPVSQLSSGEKDSTAWQYLMKASDALQRTKMARAAAAFNNVPDSYYNTCDMVGMIYQNPLLIGRLTSYPPIMALGEQERFRSMFENISKDGEFAKKLFETPRPPFQELLGETSLRAILTNKPFMTELFKLDFKDLSNYLATGSSPKFDEQILGRWLYNPDSSLAAQRRTKPKWTALEYLRLQASYRTNLTDVTIVGLLENRIVLKVIDREKNVSLVKGAWNNAGSGKYTVNWDGGGGWGTDLEIQGERLRTRVKINERENRIVVFDKE